MAPILGIVTGLALEAEILRQAARATEVPRPLIEVAGIGPGRAAEATRRVIGRGATHILSFGLAAALDPALAVGAVVVGDAGDAAWSERLAAQVQARRGRVATADVVLGTAAEKAQLRASTDAIAADMESGDVAAVAVAARKPFAVLRVISDAADQVLPPAALVAADVQGNINLARLLASVLRQPAQIPRLMRLGRSTACARQKLEALARLGLGCSFFAADLGDK